MAANSVTASGRSTSRRSARARPSWREPCSPRDVVFCHDPQTAGLVEPLLATNATVVWRCHVGIDLPNQIARQTWAFLRHYVKPAHAYVFSRREYAWEGLPRTGSGSSRPRSTSSRRRTRSSRRMSSRRSSRASDLGRVGTARPPTFERSDGSPGRVDRAAEIDQEAPIPAEAPLIAQVSRWDRLKDPVGVLRGFAEHCRDDSAHLLLAGPSVAAVSDDPEGAEVLAEVRELRSGLAPALRAPGAPRLPADGRHRGERRDGERDPAQRPGGRPKEPRRGLRADRGRGDVEGPPGDRQQSRRNPGPDRGRCDRRPDRRPARPGALRKRLR